MTVDLFETENKAELEDHTASSVVSAPEGERKKAQQRVGGSQRHFVLTRQLSQSRVNVTSLKGGHKTTVIDHFPLRFVITDSPSNASIKPHVQELLKYKVKHAVRAMDSTYSVGPLKEAGIAVHEMNFRDGDSPPIYVLERWLKLVQRCFIKQPTLTLRKFKKEDSVRFASEVSLLQPDERVSVHCVAGLGRAPVLVAVALVEFGRITPQEAIQLIREKRRGAINTKQERWLHEYVPRFSRTKSATYANTCGCVIS